MRDLRDDVEKYQKYILATDDRLCQQIKEVTYGIRKYFNHLASSFTSDEHRPLSPLNLSDI